MSFGRAKKKRRRGGEPRALQDLVGKIYPSNAPENLDAVRVFAAWDAAVPTRVSDNARPARFDRGTLYLAVTTSAWAQELELLRPDLLERVRRRATSVRALRFRVGPLPSEPHRVREPQRPVVRPLELRELPEDLARALTTVRDDDLRDEIAHAAQAELARHRRPRR